ncbi:uncharacterized protein LOC133420642 [Cololabis saira]|uniref:uncharacterized protein LOC133420642 n=1 Tax=Cololabis saira TaxID=129043 RepID=UPI002AD316B5|nr:uncharacterized protein LOC133420642 [Cololabis saira]
MKPSSPPSSSSPETSSSGPAGPGPGRRPGPGPGPGPADPGPPDLNPPPIQTLLSLQSPALQDEFLRERRNKFQSPGDPPPIQNLLSLQSPALQDEFLRERRNKFRSPGDASDASAVTSPSRSQGSSPQSSSPQSSSPSPSPSNRNARLSLSSPELLDELKAPRKQPLRHVAPSRGKTVVFRGRGGGQVSDSAPSSSRANQSVPHR